MTEFRARLRPKPVLWLGLTITHISQRIARHSGKGYIVLSFAESPLKAHQFTGPMPKLGDKVNVKQLWVHYEDQLYPHNQVI